MLASERTPRTPRAGLSFTTVGSACGSALRVTLAVAETTPYLFCARRWKVVSSSVTRTIAVDEGATFPMPWLMYGLAL